MAAEEHTLAIIKPDAARFMKEINRKIRIEGLRVKTLKPVIFTKTTAGKFYEEHKGEPFFLPLLIFMCSGPSVIEIVEGVGAVAALRKLIGHTDPQRADEGTIRKIFGSTMPANAIHGSATREDAAREISFFFSTFELSYIPTPY